MVEEIASPDPVAVADAIEARTTFFVSDPKVLAAAFVLPDIGALDQLTAMGLALGQRPQWSFGTNKLAPPPSVDLVAVRITRELPFGQETRPSEALVMGPYEEFPKTRRAPVTAFEIFVGEPALQDPKEHTPTKKVNFAHIDFRDRELINKDFTQDAIDAMWKASEAGRRKSLGGDDNRAKAKITFVIPTALATQMGCAP
ncbi:MAG TPA: hypothetical protein VGR79_03715 [Stellaceae bacterium]|nr:hypothetical protein [Stellaceae bacterium]